MEVTPSLKELVRKQFEDMPEEFRVKMNLDRPLYEAKGNAQYASGMKGRMPVFEVLNITDEIEEEIWKIARKDGMVTIKEDAMMKCFEGKIPFIELAEL